MVSIIILSYNTKTLLEECLESVIAYTKDIKYEIIVVDNASQDGSADYISKKFPHITVIKNNENAGFAKGVNIGAQHAKGEYLLFLNSDAQVTESSIKRLVETFESYEKAGIVGGMLKNTDGSLQRSYGTFYDILPAFLLLFGGDRVELVGHKSSGIRSVDWVSGGYMMIRTNVFEEVGRFDEALFMYLEDMELCKRVTNAGYSVLFNSEAHVTHIGQGSSNRQFAISHIYKGLVYYYTKHKSSLELFLLKVMLITKAYAVIIIATITNNKEHVKTYRAALRMI